MLASTLLALAVLPAPSLPVTAVDRPVIHRKVAAPVASATVADSACDLSKAPHHSKVPQKAGLSKFRKAILREAEGELGLVSPSQDGLTIPMVMTTKKGADRLLEYSMVSYGTNVDGWLGSVGPMFAKNQKHITWCGIFALWAIKSAASVTAKDYASSMGKALNNPLVAVVAGAFYDFYAPAYTDDSKWSSYRKLEWRNGAGITVPSGNTRKSKLPVGVSTWFSKHQAPPIEPGDIGYVDIPLASPPPNSDGFSHHHFLVEKIHQMGSHIVYYTIEGNFHNQQVMRWKRCYKNNEGIHAFYDVDALAN